MDSNDKITLRRQGLLSGNMRLPLDAPKTIFTLAIESLNNGNKER